MPQSFGQPAAGGRIVKTCLIAGAPIVVVRPNNVLSYAAGQVYGPAGDARIALASPALPDGALFPGFTSVQLRVVQNRGGTDPATPQLDMVVFGAQPATVLGDKDVFSISDADIALVLTTSSAWHGSITSLSTGFSTGTLNYAAGPVGRRGAVAAIALMPGQVLPPLATVYLYLVMSAAYAAPLANEQLTLTPYWVTSAGVL